jgi:hypothetical protein
MTPSFRAIAFASAFLASATTAWADVVTDWTGKAVAAGYTARAGNSMHSRNMAIVNIAMFEALNSIEARYTPYRTRLQAEPGASRDAAAASAAHHALVRLYPEQAKDFDKALQASLASIADGPAKASGSRLGEQAAAAILAERGSDASTGVVHYRPFTVAGKYVPTQAPLSSNWMAVRPFALKSADQFRPPAPYALTSAQWARDYNEIKAMGVKTASKRTAEQTDIARFWEQSGPATYNPVAHQIAAAKALDVLDNARVCALLAIATADAAIAIFDAKYAYGFWRPVTAIRNGDIDGNDATEMDAAWEPLTATPMHPEYPCAHCTFQGSAAAVLRAVFGESVPRFTMTSQTANGVTRSFERLSDYVADVVNARVYEGVHFRTSGEMGADMGRKIGEHTVQTLLKPQH